MVLHLVHSSGFCWQLYSTHVQLLQKVKIIPKKVHNFSIIRGRRATELEVLYKDFVERDNIQKVRTKKKFKSFHKSILQVNADCISPQDVKRDDESDSYQHQSRNSLYPTDDENPLLFRSHSSSLNSSSYLSLHSRKASLAKSSNTLFEKYAKLYLYDFSWLCST